MLISKVSEDGGKADNCRAPIEDNSHEYQTANELFELMAKNQNFNTNDGSTLTPRELVLLYKNIDRGTKLMTNAKEKKCDTTNQLVETVIYNDDLGSDSSDLSEVYSNEDLQSVILINKEQMDFLNCQPSVENTLCHKLGDIELQTTINTDYEKHLLFQDPYVKEQLKNANLLSINNDANCTTALPPSLLDYICCKRLEDNYNFYMDNIIRYVKNTIDQLKRISNGDYLTAKAKEKWREVEHVDDADRNNTKVLATSTSIPLHVECKIDGLKSTWDDLVHSAVDVRSLSKILEKRIIVEIPKFINGSYTLLSKCCDDNVIISCKKDNQPVDESRVNVVLKLKRSETGHVMSKINSIMILQTIPSVQEPVEPTAPLPITYSETADDSNTDDCQEDEVKEKDLNSSIQDSTQDNSEHDSADAYDGKESNSDLYDNSLGSLRYNPSFLDSSQEDASETKSSVTTLSCSQEEIQGSQTPKEAMFDVSPVDLRMTIKKLVIQSALVEESSDDTTNLLSKKKSPLRVRIKSPYENKSHAVEEKRRRKLLEIREKREKKKIALVESCKITKQKYENGSGFTQASPSVTKLSITNKSFYNSIYGTCANVDGKQGKNKNGKRKSSKEVGDTFEDCESEPETVESPSEIDTQKFINRSYYLDDTITEMMYQNMKEEEKEKEAVSPSVSGVSCDSRINLNILSQLIIPFGSELSDMANETNEQPRLDIIPKHTLTGTSDSDATESAQTNDIKNVTSSSVLNVVPANTPKKSKVDVEYKKLTSAVECRKSIDKLYKLINKTRYNSGTKSQNQFSTTNNAINVEKSSSIQESESGTSLKHQTSSSPSSFSFDKLNNNEMPQTKTSSARNVIPKVIISSKIQMSQNVDTERNKKDKKIISGNNKAQEKHNPLKAISQILHEFENVQKVRIKSVPEQKSIKRNDTAMSSDPKSSSRQGSSKRQSRLEQHHDTLDRYVRGPSVRPGTGPDASKVPVQQPFIDNRYPNTGGKRKITDILDEAKEARGEAVRGPSKFNSRLNSLAQPKKSYVQAHSEEYQTRYGRNLITDRLQRLAAAPFSNNPEKTQRIVNYRNRSKRNTTDGISPMSMKMPAPPGLPIERRFRPRHSNSNSPEAPIVVGPSYKQVNMSEPLKILKKKMIAVEPYVKNNYGRNASSPSVAEKQQFPQKLRAPVLPNDIDTGSNSSNSMPQESTEIGSKLHRIIESMICNNTHGLEVLTECQENTSKSSKDNTHVSLSENYILDNEMASIDSDFGLGAMDERILPTDNRNTYPRYNEQQDTIHTYGDGIEFKKYDVHLFKSATEFDKRQEFNLNRPLSVGTLSKHTRSNKMNLTPKSSIQQLLLLQSGDAGSLVVKASMPHKLLSNKLNNLEPIKVISKTCCDFAVIPQITTVAYSMPEYEINRHQDIFSPSLTRLIEQASKNSLQYSPRSHSVMNISDIREESLLNCSPLNGSLVINNTPEDSQSDDDRQLQQIRCVQSSQMLNFAVLPTDLERSNEKPPDVTCHLNNKPSVTSKGVITDDVNHIDLVMKNPTKLTQTMSLEDKSVSDDTSKNTKAVEYTTSLDILVGLLNEIQKITTCQAVITKNDSSDECKELEMILNNTAGVVNSIRSSYNISITSLDKLRCLESNQSIYSFYISDGELIQDSRKEKIHFTTGIDPWYEMRHNSLFYKPICVDKEVSVDIANIEYVNRLTDVPSLLFPVAINHSTHMTNSLLLEEFCQSSTQSLFSITDYHSTYSNPPPLKSSYPDSYSSKVVELVPQFVEINNVNNSIKNRNVEKTRETRQFRQKIRSFKNYTNIENNRKPVKRGRIITENQYCLESAKFDPVMKLKRDILVTVYSMLVLIVFAALSFPEMLYRVV